MLVMFLFQVMKMKNFIYRFVQRPAGAGLESKMPRRDCSVDEFIFKAIQENPGVSFYFIDFLFLISGNISYLIEL